MLNKIFILCRNLDNLIGNQNKLPWHISSDLKRFKRITKDQTILVGKNTYESLPNKTLPNRKILVLTEETYDLTDKTSHAIAKIENNQIVFNANFQASNIYICGGGMVYNFFINNKDLIPEIIIDSLIMQTHKDMNENGIFLCKNFDEILNNHYNKYFVSSILDNIITTIWIKKNSRIEENILQEIICKIKEI